MVSSTQNNASHQVLQSDGSNPEHVDQAPGLARSSLMSPLDMSIRPLNHAWDRD